MSPYYLKEKTLKIREHEFQPYQDPTQCPPYDGPEYCPDPVLLKGREEENRPELRGGLWAGGAAEGEGEDRRGEERRGGGVNESNGMRKGRMRPLWASALRRQDAVAPQPGTHHLPHWRPFLPSPAWQALRRHMQWRRNVLLRRHMQWRRKKGQICNYFLEGVICEIKIGEESNCKICAKSNIYESTV